MSEKTLLKNLIEWIIAIAAAFLLFLFMRNYVFRIADVSGSSMEPTLSHGDHVILSQLGYWFNEPQTGDIIAFPFRDNPSEFFIKRIIAVPGDVVDFQNNRFVVNGRELNFGFANVDIISRGDKDLPIIILEDEYFVLGDNRNSSKDSRYSVVGSVHKDEMIGRVFIRFWPLNRFGAVDAES